MANPYQPWGQGLPAGGYPVTPGAPPPAAAAGWPGYPGQAPPPAPGLNMSRIAAAVIAVAGLVVLLGSLAALYSVTVTPSALDVPDNDAPSGAVKIAIGFYDMVPFAPPIVAQAIPVLMLLAALTALPVIAGSAKSTAAPAVFSGAATLLGLVLAVSNPLPSVKLSGDLSSKLASEAGGQTVDQMVDAVVSISPGAGLIVAIVFSLLAWLAGIWLMMRRDSAEGMPVMPAVPGMPGSAAPAIGAPAPGAPVPPSVPGWPSGTPGMPPAAPGQWSS